MTIDKKLIYVPNSFNWYISSIHDSIGLIEYKFGFSLPPETYKGINKKEKEKIKRKAKKIERKNQRNEKGFNEGQIIFQTQKKENLQLRLLILQDIFLGLEYNEKTNSTHFIYDNFSTFNIKTPIITKEYFNLDIYDSFIYSLSRILNSTKHRQKVLLKNEIKFNDAKNKKLEEKTHDYNNYFLKDNNISMYNDLIKQFEMMFGIAKKTYESNPKSMITKF